MSAPVSEVRSPATRTGRTVMAAAAASWLILAGPAAAQGGATDPEASGLSQDIENLQSQIESAVSAERERLVSRRAVAELLQRADLAADAGNLDAADAALDEALRTARPDDQATLNRVALAQVSMKIRRGDLAGAGSLLETIAKSPSLSDAARQRVENLSGRIGKAAEASERKAVIAAITALATDTAVENARVEVARDPGNTNLRLLFVDLLRKSGEYEEATANAKALLNERSGEVDITQRSLLALGRIAVDQGEFKTAAIHLEALRRTSETLQKARRIADLEERMARQKAKSASAEVAARRKALLEQISAMAGPAAIDRAREAVAADPQDVAMQLFLGELLRKAESFEDARQLAEQISTDALARDSLDDHQKALVLLARIAIDQGDFTTAGRLRDELAASGETARREERLVKLDEAIVRQQTRIAEMVLAAKRKAVVESIRALDAKARGSAPEDVPSQ